MTELGQTVNEVRLSRESLKRLRKLEKQGREVVVLVTETISLDVRDDGEYVNVATTVEVGAK